MRSTYSEACDASDSVPEVNCQPDFYSSISRLEYIRQLANHAEALIAGKREDHRAVGGTTTSPWTQSVTEHTGL